METCSWRVVLAAAVVVGVRCMLSLLDAAAARAASLTSVQTGGDDVDAAPTLVAVADVTAHASRLPHATRHHTSSSHVSDSVTAATHVLRPTYCGPCAFI